MLGKFYDRHKKLFFIIVLFALPLLPLSLSRYPLPRLHIHENFTSYVVHPLTDLLQGIFSGVKVLTKRYIFLVSVSKENEKLVKINEELSQRILSLEEVKNENHRLKELFSISEKLESPRAVGRIIGEDSSAEHFGFFIDLGSKDGLKERMPVLTPQGVVGTIVEVYPRSALFVSIVDPSHDVDGIVVRSRARAIIEGRGNSLVGRLKYLDRSEDVRVGDEVLTSGLDGVFPKGLSIGTIVSVKRPQSGISQEALMRPAVDIGKLEEVIIILKTVDEYGKLSMNSAGQ